MRNPRLRVQPIAFAIMLMLCACAPQSPVATAQPTASFTLTPTSVPIAIGTPTAAPFEVVRMITGDLHPLSIPIDVAFDSTGNLYVLEAGAGRIQVFDPTGKSLRVWGTDGSKPGQFNLNLPENGIPLGYGGIVVDKNNNVLVADALNQRVQKFDGGGRLIMEWGGEGIQNGHFLRALDLTIGANGNVYVIDDRRDDVQVFTPQGRFIKAFGSHGQGNGQLSNTGNITLGPDGNLYVADFENDRVEVFTPQGQYLRKWRTSYPPAGIAFDRQGNIYVTDDNDLLTEYDSSGKVTAVIDSLGMNSPLGIAVDASGLIYVADQENNRILVLKHK